MRRRVPDQVELTADLRCFDAAGLGDVQVWDAFTAWCATRRAYEREHGWPGGPILRLLAEADVRRWLRDTHPIIAGDPPP